MKWINLTVTHNEHFWVRKNQNRQLLHPTSSCLKIKISGKWHIPQIFEIILESYNLAVIKRVSNPFPRGTNRQMFFHGLITLSKEIFTVMTLLNNTIRYSFYSLFKTTNITSIGKVNLVCDKTRPWNPFVVNGLIGSQQYLSQFFPGKLSSYYFISIKFFNDRTKKVSCHLIFSLNFFLYKKSKHLVV